jgi:monofunctional biosynthetic peptidoglycan transglycosylase
MFKFLSSVWLILLSGLGLLVVAVGLFFLTTPRPTDIKGCLKTKMFEVDLCPTSPRYVKLKNISAYARNAVVVSEDAAFYGHQGFDWDELQNSFQKNMEKGGFARGGSTITQQLAKNVYLSSEKSLLRKLREAVITVQLEKSLSKDEILEKYLNVVEFGPNVYGIGPAANYYFHKSASELTPAEGAFLAFLLPNPKKYSVSFRSKTLTKFAHRQVTEIVDRLLRFRKITPEEHSAAIAQVGFLFGGAPDPSLEQAMDSGTTVVTPDDEAAPISEDTSEDEAAFESGDYEE